MRDAYNGCKMRSKCLVKQGYYTGCIYQCCNFCENKCDSQCLNNHLICKLYIEKFGLYDERKKEKTNE